MKEEDIMKRITEESKELPIPERLSPENMENMLNDYMEHNPAHDNTKKRVSGRQFGTAMAACFAVLLLGISATGIVKWNRERNSSTSTSDYAAEMAVEEAADSELQGKNKNESISSDEAVETADDSATAESFDSDEEENEQLETDLALAGDLSTPESYEDYYDTIRSAYEEYYARFSDVYNYDIGGITEAPAVEYETNGDDKSTDGYSISDDVRDYAAEEAAADDSDYASFDDAAGATNSVQSSDFSDNITEAPLAEEAVEDAEASSASKEYSTTNTQEKTVDEGDIVKTDGEYIYTARYTAYYYDSYYDSDSSPTITITKADDGKLSEVSTIKLDYLIADNNSTTYEYCRFQDFYLYKDSLIVLYTREREFPSAKYSYTLYRTNSNIVIYDISNRENPKKQKTLTQSGYYEGSRISDGYLYTVSSFYTDNDIFDDPKTDASDYERYIPYLNNKVIPCDSIYYSRHLLDMNTYVVTSVDLDNPDDFADAKSVAATGAQLYVGTASIYLYSTLYDEIEKTEIMKIGYKKGRLTVGSRAVIAGYLYDSFALSEYDGHLRIVATIPANSFSWFDRGVWRNSADGFDMTLNEDINALYILDQNMRLTGRITGIAPGERIYSARYFGDIGYFVTYENTDPLFSVDLSDPTEPKIIGKLKIPGFSRYLHFYGTDTLLGIGEERDPYTQNFEGIKLSMFDIQDPSNVTEEDKFILKDAYYSSALYNHKAIMIDPVKNVFGFCFECEYYNRRTGEYDYLYDSSFEYCYATYTYDKEKGFVETARYPLDFDYMYNLEDVRGLYIGDYFYLVTPEFIKSYKLGTEKRVDTLYF